MPEDAIRQVIEPLGLEVKPFDEEQAYKVGLLHAATSAAGISLGDRACLNLGKILGVVTLTADKMWKGLDVNVNIKVIR